MYPEPNLKVCHLFHFGFPDGKVHGANMGSIEGQQDPGGPHVGPMNLAIMVVEFIIVLSIQEFQLQK